MFKKILIANRGEIALRIIRACREMNITSAVIYSEADRNSLPVLLADEAYFVGKSSGKDSYLNISNIVQIIKESKAEALHPGYGFLSENAHFAKTLKEAGIIFIGPSAESIETMGDKVKARQVMKDAGVPIVHGSDGHVTDFRHLRSICKDIGFPIILKAAFGGGGKGMRVVHNLDDLKLNYQSAKSEALNSFTNDEVYVEKFIQNPKHIEIQIFADTHHNVVHLYERECSAQRRHQKIIEESPSTALPEDVRKEMGKIAVQAAKSINYLGAGTFEFIFDNSSKKFFFMEMNTRLQVEHPVTEMVTGFDLVKEQINVAAGNLLSFKQEDIRINGHAIEARVCAEDPKTYLPSPGNIQHCQLPQGPFIRLDSFIYSGSQIPIYYDSMIAKLIAWGRCRKEAINRLQRALSEMHIFGVKTNITLLQNILRANAFVDGSYTTHLLDRDFKIDPFDKQDIDEQTFLIASAIKVYETEKKRYICSSENQWKHKGRLDSLR